jgi:hypothetical protein
LRKYEGSPKKANTHKHKGNPIKRNERKRRVNISHAPNLHTYTTNPISVLRRKASKLSKKNKPKKKKRQTV